MDSHDKKNVQPDANSKRDAMKRDTEESTGEYLTTNTGLRINNTDDSLKAGSRGPTLMEDFHFREKMTHFDHERIPERVVHARGSAAHGYFELYESLSEFTRASIFQDTTVKTPVFVRFSTVVGSRGSADTVRDARGFATKFYTADGNWDLVGNNIPVFFIQDGIKFPDLVHSVKPEPHHEMPQASAAHDNFWDFISLTPESMHMIMWVLSDRALPRSYRMMDGFGVHTFRLVNEQGKARFVKFHWKAVLGAHSLVWDETQKLAGKDPDFNRRDLWEAIEKGQYPQYELGMQIVEEEDEHKFDFDLLDATKIIPEEEVPVRIVGKMTLNRNPDNFFAETEQAAFHPGHVVPGIDFTNDPLLQGRLFSYIDTQLIRLGGPNFNEIPINRPVVEVHNNQRDGYSRQTINRGKTNYSPNSRNSGCPMHTPEAMRGFVHYAEKVEGYKIRERSESFNDHYSQATLFWNSMSDPEKDHIVEAAQFELGKVEIMEIREKMIEHFNNIDHTFATRVAAKIGVAPPPAPESPNHGKSSPALSMEKNKKEGVATRQVAALVADGFDGEQLSAVKKALKKEGAELMVVSKLVGTVTSASGDTVKAEKSFLTAASVMFDAIYIPGGASSVEALSKTGDARHWINEAFKHCKPIGATGEGVELLAKSDIGEIGTGGSDSGSDVMSDQGVVTSRAGGDGFAGSFIAAIAEHRHWSRAKDAVPA